MRQYSIVVRERIFKPGPFFGSRFGISEQEFIEQLMLNIFSQPVVIEFLLVFADTQQSKRPRSWRGHIDYARQNLFDQIRPR